ncbi:MAG: outer membrane beta-barrel protein [Proteobacteria bacterium]|nr:outer membrane beta-barrel protein [Pseudomonadota bacterium]
MKIALFSTTLLASSIAMSATAIDGWYGSVFGGYSYLSNNVSKYRYGNYFSNPSYENGYNAGARFGFQSNPMRYEAEFTYISAKPEKFRVNNLLVRGYKGYSSASVGMLNAYYDFPELIPCISPFLGAGLGYSWIATHLNSYQPYGPARFKGSNGAFAYQGTAGLTYNFAESFALNIAYRYVGTTEPDNLGKRFQANLASAGIVFRFNESNYK